MEEKKKKDENKKIKSESAKLSLFGMFFLNV